MHHLSSRVFLNALLIFTVTVGIFNATPSYSAENTIRFGISHKEYPPYLMSNKSDLLGIIADTFQEVSKK